MSTWGPEGIFVATSDKEPSKNYYFVLEGVWGLKLNDSGLNPAWVTLIGYHLSDKSFDLSQLHFLIFKMELIIPVFESCGGDSHL